MSVIHTLPPRCHQIVNFSKCRLPVRVVAQMVQHRRCQNYIVAPRLQLRRAKIALQRPDLLHPGRCHPLPRRASASARSSPADRWQNPARIAAASTCCSPPRTRCRAPAESSGVAATAARVVSSSVNGASMIAFCPVSRFEKRSTSASNRARISSIVDFDVMAWDRLP